MNFIDKVKKFVNREKVSFEQAKEITDNIGVLISLSGYTVEYDIEHYDNIIKLSYSICDSFKSWHEIELEFKKGFIRYIDYGVFTSDEEWERQWKRYAWSEVIYRPSLSQVNELLQSISSNIFSEKEIVR